MLSEGDRMEGIENNIHNHRSNSNIYSNEYRDAPSGGLKARSLQSEPRRTSSTQSLRSGSATSLKDVVSNSPTGEPRRQRTPVAAKRTITKIDKGVPQTDV